VHAAFGWILLPGPQKQATVFRHLLT